MLKNRLRRVAAAFFGTGVSPPPLTKIDRRAATANNNIKVGAQLQIEVNSLGLIKIGLAYCKRTNDTSVLSQKRTLPVLQ